MKNLTILATLLLGLSLTQTAYGLDTVPIGQEFVIKPGQTVAIKHTKINIMFDSVLSDSRCPIKLRCVWAGNAEVKLILQRSSKKTFAIVNTGIKNRAVEYRGYRIQLLKLNPGRRNGEITLSNQYEATFKINRIK